MSHRLQITLDDRQYDALVLERDRTGASLAELVRQAVDEKLGAGDPARRAEAFRRAVHHAVGAWSDREEDGMAYQRRVRAGLADRGRTLGR
jgi:hypothetical protein